MRAFDVLTLGEPMVLFSAGTAGPLRHVSHFAKYTAGAELNFSIALTRLGIPTGFVTKLGEDEFGEFILACMRAEGLDTSLVSRSALQPTGVYFKEYRGPGDPKVHYYRRGSAASALSSEDLRRDWLAGVKIVHITGITPALSSSCQTACEALLDMAEDAGAAISFDPNYRPLLHDRMDVRRFMADYLRRADILFMNEREAELLFGSTDFAAVRRQAHEMGPRTVVLKLGRRGAAVSTVSDGTSRDAVQVPALEIERFVDPVGAGDGFAAGFLFGLMSGWPPEKCLAAGNYVGAMATTVAGDYEGYPFLAELLPYLNLPCSARGHSRGG
ncbi:MAG TPA: sugar kinase [Bacillota bacterium]|nr:sugar kinase [Bacillota bacterium]